MRCIDPIRHTRTLQQWRGCPAKIWSFHPSLGRLALQIHRPLVTGELYVVTISCAQIRGPFSWDDNQIDIVHEPSATDASWVVRDLRADFLLVCGGVGLVEGTAPLGPWLFDEGVED